ncbi:MAG: iron-containing alcohol dehydrogenase, partial [Desulfobacterales bacterium]
RLIAANLPEAVKNPQNTKARGKLQTAATLAGWAFTVAQVGLAHAVAHSLGALLEVPHGIACGIMLPHVMRYNAEFAVEGLSMVAEALGAEISGTSQSTHAALAAADQIRVLMEQIDHPMSLSAMGVDKDRFMDIAVHAVADPAVMFNPRPPGGPAGIMEILEAAR